MATYAIGDIQGCGEALHELLALIDFDPAADRLWFTGDLVNRGPDSLEVLRYVKSLGDRAVTVLGNHDIHLLAVWAGYAEQKRKDSLQPVLDAPDCDELMHWLRRQPLLHEDAELGYVMVHAGIHPSWNLDTARRCAAEVEAALGGDNPDPYFAHLYGDQPDRWSDKLAGEERLRFITNVFTRMRYCDKTGRLLHDCKESPEEAPTGYLPWYTVPGRRTTASDPTIIFGHWSTLGYRDERNILALDTGCLWGGQLTAVRLDLPRPARTSLPCRPVMHPRGN